MCWPLQLLLRRGSANTVIVLDHHGEHFRERLHVSLTAFERLVQQMNLFLGAIQFRLDRIVICIGAGVAGTRIRCTRRTVLRDKAFITWFNQANAKNTPWPMLV